MGDAKRRPEADEATEAAGIRRPYERPAVTWEEPLEERPGLIVACNKAMGQSMYCDAAASS